MSKKIYKNGTKINRCEHDKEHPYTMVANDIIRDERLDLLEVGIMTHLLSHDVINYTINTTYIQKISGIGQDRFYKKIKHLTELGYINKIPILGGVNWIINETPLQVIENGTSSENTNRVNTSSENTSSENTSSENTSRVSPTQRSNNETTTKEQSKNEINKNETSKNISVVGEQVENYSLGLNPEEVDLNLSVFDDLNKSITSIPKVEFIDVYKLNIQSSYFNFINLDRLLALYSKVLNEYNMNMKFEQFEKTVLFMVYMSDPKEIIDNYKLNMYCKSPFQFYIEKDELKIQLDLFKTKPNLVSKLNQICELLKSPHSNT